jgi:hypothetical protein
MMQASGCFASINFAFRTKIKERKNPERLGSLSPLYPLPFKIYSTRNSPLTQIRDDLQLLVIDEVFLAAFGGKSLERH